MLLPRMRRYFILARLTLSVIYLGVVSVMLFDPAVRPHGLWLFLDGMIFMPSLMTAVLCARALRNRAALDTFPEFRWMVE